MTNVPALQPGLEVRICQPQLLSGILTASRSWALGPTVQSFLLTVTEEIPSIYTLWIQVMTSSLGVCTPGSPCLHRSPRRFFVVHSLLLLKWSTRLAETLIRLLPAFCPCWTLSLAMAWVNYAQGPITGLTSVVTNCLWAGKCFAPKFSPLPM